MKVCSFCLAQSFLLTTIALTRTASSLFSTVGPQKGSDPLNSTGARLIKGLPMEREPFGSETGAAIALYAKLLIKRDLIIESDE